MIGGYIYRECDSDLESRLRDRLDDSHATFDAWDGGFLFHDEPYRDRPTGVYRSQELIVLSQDLLVTVDAGGEYRHLDLASEFPPSFQRNEAAALDSIASDFRMAVVRKRERRTILYLVSNRAGSGRMYYHSTATGVVFCSDLRFLFPIVGREVNLPGIYAILKYGAIPEPWTVSRDVSAVPPSHYLEVDPGGGDAKTVPYFRLRFDCERDGVGERDDDEILGPVTEALRRSSRFLQESRPAILMSGGIDSSLYGCYMSEEGDAPRGFYCAFGEDDPELEHAGAIAKRIGSELHVARMETKDAIDVLGEVTRLTDHPFADFSSLPIAFLLRYAREKLGEGATVVECNGGDDCFGFPDLGSESKVTLKHRFPGLFKSAMAAVLRNLPHWKWESHEGVVARLSALADSREARPLDYCLVLTPVRYLGLEASREWDDALSDRLEDVFSGCGEDYERLSFRGKATVRQLMHVNSRRWAAKALSVGESLGLRMVYPYIWREVLREQGRVPWAAKIRDGTVKWPLKKLLEEYMPSSFIYRRKSGFVPPFATWLTDDDFNDKAREVLLDANAVVARVAPRPLLEELLSDAAGGKRLRHSVLNFLWGALFTEMWIQRWGQTPGVGRR